MRSDRLHNDLLRVCPHSCSAAKEPHRGNYSLRCFKPTRTHITREHSGGISLNAGAGDRPCATVLTPVPPCLVRTLLFLQGSCSSPEKERLGDESVGLAVRSSTASPTDEIV